jgi:hypothetical protein
MIKHSLDEFLTAIFFKIFSHERVSQVTSKFRKICNHICIASTYYFFLVSPKISRENSKYFAQRKSLDQKLKCIINLSNPSPTVTWSQQDLPTSSSEANPDEDKWTVSNYKSKLIPTHRGEYNGILTIPWEKEESSFYRCFAGNNYGNDSRVFKFIRYGKKLRIFTC